MSEKEKIISKIQKMMALAASDPESEEAKTAARMAGELMAKYEIEFTSIKETRDDDLTVEYHKCTVNANVEWQGGLANSIAKAFDMRVVRSDEQTGSGDPEWMWTFIGYKHDMILTIWYFKYLKIMLGKRIEAHGYKGRREYALGLVIAINERLKEMCAIRDEHRTSETSALVVTKKYEVESKMHDMFPKLTKNKARNIKDSDALRRGIADGKNISLSRPVQGGSSSSGYSIKGSGPVALT